MRMLQKLVVQLQNKIKVTLSIRQILQNQHTSGKHTSEVDITSPYGKTTDIIEKIIQIKIVVHTAKLKLF